MGVLFLAVGTLAFLSVLLKKDIMKRSAEAEAAEETSR